MGRLLLTETFGFDGATKKTVPLDKLMQGCPARVQGRALRVSGVLYDSDLVLYDRATETLWDQIEAQGIVGPMTGDRLTLVPV